MKEFSRNEISMFKKVAALVYPYDKKNKKLQETIEKAQAEIESNNKMVEGIEKLVIEKTGYHVLDLFYLEEKPTNRLNEKGAIIYDRSWQPKYETIIPVNEVEETQTPVGDTNTDPENQEESAIVSDSVEL